MQTRFLFVIAFILLALGLWIGLFIGIQRRVPCPVYDASAVDSLTEKISQLRIDSAIQHNETLLLQAAIEQDKATTPSVPTRVSNAYSIALSSHLDSLIRGFHADPPEFD